MKTTTIHVSFDEEKIGALNLYLGLKNMTLEGVRDFPCYA